MAARLGRSVDPAPSPRTRRAARSPACAPRRCPPARPPPMERAPSRPAPRPLLLPLLAGLSLLAAPGRRAGGRGGVGAAPRSTAPTGVSPQHPAPRPWEVLELPAVLELVRPPRGARWPRGLATLPPPHPLPAPVPNTLLLEGLVLRTCSPQTPPPADELAPTMPTLVPVPTHRPGQGAGGGEEVPAVACALAPWCQALCTRSALGHIYAHTHLYPREGLLYPVC